MNHHSPERKNNGGASKQTVLHVKEDMELMPFLEIHFNGKSRSDLKSILTHKQVVVNGDPQTKYNFKLKAGDTVTLNSRKVNDYKLRNPRLKIVYEDDAVIVVEKSQGLLAVPTNEQVRGASAYGVLTAYLREKDPTGKIYVVHRIDRETSGLMMFVKTPEVQDAMRNDWHNVVKERVYLAVVEGTPELEEDTITSFLHESKAYKMYSSDYEDGGKMAITHYRVVRKSPNYSMLKVELETGRKNQIRVHMGEIGHPIIGDRKYGSTDSPIGRLALHAKVLAFQHPVTHAVLRFETPVPREFNALFVQEHQKELEIQKEHKERNSVISSSFKEKKKMGLLKNKMKAKRKR